MNPQDADPISKEQADPAAAPSSKAVPPDNTPPAAAELIDDIDAYQKRIEREWESAKSIYQSRISEIMDDFLKKGATDAPTNGRPAAGRAKQNGATPETLESMVSRVANELRAMDSRARANGAAPERLQLPAPAPRPTFLRKFLVVALAVAVVVGAAVAIRMPAWTPLPYARTGAIAVANGKIYVADWLRKTLYVHSIKRGAPIAAVEALPVGLVAGLQPKGDVLWTVDGLSHEILKHTMTSDHQVTDRFPAPDAKPAGLVLDRDDLWVAGLDTKTLFRLRADDPTDVRDRFEFAGGNVTAMQMQAKRLWVLDGKARELTVFRIQKPLKALATFDLDPFLRGATPTGLAISGSTAWIVTENPSAIARVPLSKIKKSKSSEF